VVVAAAAGVAAVDLAVVAVGLADLAVDRAAGAGLLAVGENVAQQFCVDDVA
jgi:hypothetical protein